MVRLDEADEAGPIFDCVTTNLAKTDPATNKLLKLSARHSVDGGPRGKEVLRKKGIESTTPTSKAQPSVIPKASTTPQPRAMSVEKIKEPKADEAVLLHATPSPSPSPSLSLLFSLLLCLLSYSLKPKSVHMLPAG